MLPVAVGVVMLLPPRQLTWRPAALCRPPSGSPQRLGRPWSGVPAHAVRARPPRGAQALCHTILCCVQAPNQMAASTPLSRPLRLLCMQALTPLTIGRSNVRATMLGALWGFGHSIGQLILGLLMVLLKVNTFPLGTSAHATQACPGLPACIAASAAPQGALFCFCLFIAAAHECSLSHCLASCFTSITRSSSSYTCCLWPAGPLHVAGARPHKVRLHNSRPHAAGNWAGRPL